MFRSNPKIDRFINFFSLYSLYLKIKKVPECNKISKFKLAFDLLELFYRYKTFPDNYCPCRLWGVEKSNWKYYYGNNYQSYQKSKLIRNKVQPREYAILFDDKEICERLCREIGVKTPNTYGTISTNDNYKDKIKNWLQISPSQTLFIKPILGAGGKGICIAKNIHNNASILTKEGLIALDDFNLVDRAIVQDLVNQDKRLSVFSSTSVNTMRVVTMYTKRGEIIILAAIFRSAVGESYIDNVCAGGIGVGIECETGRLMKYGYDYKGSRYAMHPTSKIIFDGFMIPEWTRIVDISLRVQKSFPCYRLLGMDVALDESGDPVLIEINDSPDLLFMENACGPLLIKKENLRAFGEYGLLFNTSQQKLYKRIELS
jgi:hypothetical protein